MTYKPTSHGKSGVAAGKGAVPATKWSPCELHFFSEILFREVKSVFIICKHNIYV